MWIRLACRGSVAFVNEWLVRVNARANSLSSNLSLEKLRMVVDVVERHLSRESARLTAGEMQRIRAERLAWLARAECNSAYLHGLPSMLRSALMGYRPFEAIQFLVSASPPSRWLKQRIFFDDRSCDARWPVSHSPGRGRTAPRTPHPMLPSSDAALSPFPRTRTSAPRCHSRCRRGIWTGTRRFLAKTAASRRWPRSSVPHEIFRRFGVVPTYAVDYPVVSDEAGYRPLLELLEAGACEIGAQLHTWVTPPFEEPVSEETSYAGNLAASLERRKLETLVDAIERRFETRPRLYRAGRYGAGLNTAAIIEELEFDIDCSVVPGISTWSPSAPDYSGGTARPYWLATKRPLLELPVTVASVGPARPFGESTYRRPQPLLASQPKLGALMARTRLLNRIRLTPEGNTLSDCKYLTRNLVARGYRFFAISYHSPSLEPGHTPYVRNTKDLELFLRWIERYLEFFFEEMNGIADTPGGLYHWARSHIPRVSSNS